MVATYKPQAILRGGPADGIPLPANTPDGRIVRYVMTDDREQDGDLTLLVWRYTGRIPTQA